MTGIAFADTYPAGLVNVSPLSPPVANSCDGNVTAAAGGSSISLNGGTLAAGATCSVVVHGDSGDPRRLPQHQRRGVGIVAGSGNTASDTLIVETPNPAIGLQKLISTSPTGPWFTFVIVRRARPSYYRFTAENTGDVALHLQRQRSRAGRNRGRSRGVRVADHQCADHLAGAARRERRPPTRRRRAWSARSSAVRRRANTATAHGIFARHRYDSALPRPTIPRGAGIQPGEADRDRARTVVVGDRCPAGTSVYYKFTIVNTGGLDLTGSASRIRSVSTASCTFTDPLAGWAATTCVVGPVAARARAGAGPPTPRSGTAPSSVILSTPPSSASYTISHASADLAITKTDGVSTATPAATTYTIVVSNTAPLGLRRNSRRYPRPPT